MNSAWNCATIFNAIARSAILLACAMILSACSGYFFYPQKQLVRVPSDVNLHYQDVIVQARDGVDIHGWLLQAEAPKGIVFFLHGNAENISTHIGSVYWLPEQGYDVLLMDYRGYGQSQGSPNFPQVFWDVDAMYRWLQDYAESKQLPVYILGQSLGASISSVYFSQLPKGQIIFQGVVLDAVFSGHRDITKDALRASVITWPFQFIAPHFVPKEFDPKSHVQHFSPTPVLFFHSPDDAVIPYHHGQVVYQNALNPKYWADTKGPHIATFGYPDSRRILLNFFANPNQNPNTSFTSTTTPTDRQQTDSSAFHGQKSTSAHALE